MLSLTYTSWEKLQVGSTCGVYMLAATNADSIEVVNYLLFILSSFEFNESNGIGLSLRPRLTTGLGTF